MSSTAQPFLKMHGLGNDFVVLDARTRPLALSDAQVRAISDRKSGVGCDQLITVEPSTRADAFMRIHNADGGEVEACGNATRCVARLLMDERGTDAVAIETVVGVLKARADGPDLITVDMGEPHLDWREIPLARAMDTLRLDYRMGSLQDPVAVNVGNPHLVFFVPEVASIDIATLGPQIETDPLFPLRINVEVAQILGRDRIRMRVWERGAGITRACGTGACATLVAAARRGLTDRKAVVELDGGPLTIEWNGGNRILMTGPVSTSFAGTLGAELMNPDSASPATGRAA